MSSYAKGTIKVKNVNGELIPFYPNTKSDCVKDETTGTALSATLTQMQSSVTALASQGSVSVTYTEPTDSSMQSASNESLTVYIDNSN